MKPWPGGLLILAVLGTFGCESDQGFKTVEGRV